MSNSRKAVRDEFCRLVLAEVSEIVSALPYEPGDEALPDLPALTMRADFFGQIDRETGPVTDNTHGWEVSVYVALADSADASAYESAQADIEDLVPEVYGVLRKHPDLSGTCEWTRVEDSGEPVEFLSDRHRSYARKLFRLRAETFETVT